MLRRAIVGSTHIHCGATVFPELLTKGVVHSDRAAYMIVCGCRPKASRTEQHLQTRQRLISKALFIPRSPITNHQSARHHAPSCTSFGSAVPSRARSRSSICGRAGGYSSICSLRHDRQVHRRRKCQRSRTCRLQSANNKVQWFVKNSCKQPEPKTCLFYTSGLSKTAQKAAEKKDATYTTIWVSLSNHTLPHVTDT